MRGLGLICFIAAAAAGPGTSPAFAEAVLVWPTPNSAWAEQRDASDYVQPTISGRVESALFGCVRNGGRRFHEGVDLKPTSRDSRGEATDPVFAVMDGTVRYVNRIAGNSSYGRYAVIEHGEANPPVVTLYAHLANFRDGIEEGAHVRAGQAIGTMGRSAGGYTIPRHRAHLHFEIGFRVTDDFDDWYEWRDYETANRHGNYSGLNLVGINPVEFFDHYRSGRAESILDYIQSQPEAFVLRVKSDEVPDFVRRYSSLLERPWIPSNLTGWEIGFTWYGVPKRWRAIGDEGEWDADDKVEIVSFDRQLLTEKACRQTVRIRGGEPVVGSHTERVLQLLFGFR